MDLTSRRARAQRRLAALTVVAALATGGTVALGGGVAGAGPGSPTATASIAPNGGPAAVGFSPPTVRWLRAVATCAEMYPPGTDIRDCIANLY